MERERINCTKEWNKNSNKYFSYDFVLLRFKLAKVCVSKDRETVMECLTEFFKELGGVPKTIVFYNMKSVMDFLRTRNSEGKVNAQFKQFSDDMGFNVFTCMAGRPETKAKVESPMRILDDIKAYNGDLTLKQLTEKFTL